MPAAGPGARRRRPHAGRIADTRYWRSSALGAARHVGGARLSGPLNVARAAGPSQEGAVVL
jgi:hypothetical protein